MPFQKRRPSWLVSRRCLAILLRLAQGPANGEELREAVRLSTGPAALQGDAERTLENDLHYLRNRWDVELTYERESHQYQLMGLPFPLLALPPGDLITLAFLYHNFTSSTPQGDEVHALLNRLVALLPEEQSRQVQRLRTIPDLELEVLDPEEIEDDVWSAVEKAIMERRQLSFCYRPISPERGTAEARRLYRVEPYGVDFLDGHYYLEAYCLQLQIDDRTSRHRGTRQYRLSRITPGSIQILPDKLPPGPRTPEGYVIRYRLSPAIACGGVTARFPETRIKILPDGSAEVEAWTTNLWRARQAMLRYGENCRVLAPEALVTMMRESVSQMALYYRTEKEPLARDS